MRFDLTVRDTPYPLGPRVLEPEPIVESDLVQRKSQKMAGLRIGRDATRALVDIGLNYETER